MRGLDGNFINTQGDSLARLQVAYQAEQNRQQIRAQTEAIDSLRKLREQVNEPEKKESSGGPREVKDDQGSNSEFFQGRENAEPDSTKKSVEEADERLGSEVNKTHIDIRV